RQIPVPEVGPSQQLCSRELDGRHGRQARAFPSLLRKIPGGPPARATLSAFVSAAPEHRVLVTGGAGFVGANLAIALAERHPGWEIVACDTLKRRGSELNLSLLRSAAV